jgi:hypothetical protein
MATLKPITDFSLFLDLPLELRLKIWREVCHTSRVVEIHYNLDDGRFVCSCNPPSVLQVCRESRSEALKIYKLSFGSPAMPPHVYFYPGIDRVYFTRRNITLEAEFWNDWLCRA